MYICIFSGTFGRGTSRMVNIAQNSAGAGYTGSKFLSVCTVVSIIFALAIIVNCEKLWASYSEA